MLIAACVHGDEDVIRGLLSLGHDSNVADDLGRTPLMHAALNAQPEATRLLLDAGASLNAADAYRHTPLMACFSSFFVGFAWDVDFAGRNRQVARMLLEAGADVMAQDLFGATPLTYAWVNTQLEAQLDLVLPHHFYHVSMYDMLQQHAISFQAATTTTSSAAAAA